MVDDDMVLRRNLWKKITHSVAKYSLR